MPLNAPLNLESAKLLYRGLKQCGIRIVAALPETWLVPVVNLIKEDSEMKLVTVAREEEAVAICMGAHLGGVKAAVVIQNHGLFACVNPIVSLGALYKLPVLLLISYRGSFGENDPWHTVGGSVTEPLLDAINVPYQCVTDQDKVLTQIADAHALAESSLMPVALLLTRQLMLERE